MNNNFCAVRFFKATIRQFSFFGLRVLFEIPFLGLHFLIVGKIRHYLLIREISVNLHEKQTHRETNFVSDCSALYVICIQSSISDTIF